MIFINLVLKIFVFLTLLASKSKSKPQATSEQEIADLWMSKNFYQTQINQVSKQSDRVNATNKCDQLSRLRAISRSAYNSSCHSGNEISETLAHDDHDTSASMLKLNHHSSPQTHLKSEFMDNVQSDKLSKSNSKHNNDKQAQNKKKKNKLKFFNNQSKKVFFNSLLPKSSKRQVTAETTKTNKEAHRHSQNNNNNELEAFDSFLFNSFPSQPLMSFPKGQLMFGPHPLPHLPPLNAFSTQNFLTLPRVPPANQIAHINFNQAARGQMQAPMSLPNRQSLDHNAAQSMEHYQRIRLTDQAEQPMFYASGDGHGRVELSMVKGNNTSEPLPDTTVKAQQSVSTQIWPAIAAALSGERAKSLINQMSGGTSSLANKSGTILNNVRNYRDTTDSMMKSATNNAELAGMIKSAAEVWAVTRANSDPAPAIIMEHDGPTVTTVDFGNNLPAQRVVENDPPEDDEVSQFYSEENTDEETEGSNEAKRVAKLNKQQHPFEPDHSPLDFFYSQDTSETTGSTERLQHKKSPINQFAPVDPLPEYMRYEKDIEQSSPPVGSYPESINAIKEQHNNDIKEKTMSNLGSELSNSNQNQIAQLIKELQALNKRKQRHNQVEDTDKKSKFQDDYDDLLSNDEDEDEQVRLLRKKIMLRLRNRPDRSPGKRGPKTSSSFQEAAVKIPLHALLMAALDRRMSSSEPGSTVIQDLIGDQRNKDVVNYVQQDFNQITSGLDPLLDTSRLYESLVNTPLDNSTNLVFEVTTGPDTSSKLLPNASQPVDLGATNKNETITENRAPQNSTDRLDQSFAATTRMPTIAHRRLIGRAQAGDNTREGANEVSDENEGDFDLERQVNEFSKDTNDPSLEPSWIRGREGARRRGRKQSSPDDSVKFDDESDDGSRSRNVLKRRRILPKEHSYEVKENRFLDRLNNDFSDDSDLDKNTSGIENPIEAASEERQPRRRVIISKRDNDESESDEDDSDDDGDRADEDTGSRQQPTRIHRASRGRHEGWKPHMIDEEVRKIEEVAKKRRKDPPEDPTSDYSESDEDHDRTEETPDRRGEETAESRTHETTTRPENGVKLSLGSLEVTPSASHPYYTPVN